MITTFEDEIDIFKEFQKYWLPLLGKEIDHYPEFKGSKTELRNERIYCFLKNN